MFKRFLLVASAAATIAILNSCASTTSDTLKTTEMSAGEDAKLFADYLIGSYTNYIDDAENRAAFYSSAFDADENDVNLARRAITSTISAGDVDETRKLAADVLSYHPEEPMSRAILGSAAFARGDYSEADEYLSLETNDRTVKIMMDMILAWSKSAQGDTEKGSEILASLGGGAYFQVLGRVMQANMLGAEGDLEKAKESYDLAEASGVADTSTALSRARIVSRSGDISGALEKLEEFASQAGGFELGPVKSYLDDLQGGQPVSGDLTPQQEASWALTDAAYGFFVRNRAFDFAEVYIRTALDIDPTNDRAKIWLAALIEDSRQDEALSLFRSVGPDSDYAVSARLSEANVFFDRDEDETALKILEAANRDYPSLTTREALGRARLIRENYEDALPIYDALVKSMTVEEIENDIQPLYFRAVCYERVKEWDKSVADFKRVLEIDPENADALNYLGYTWVDRNENLNEAFDMIEKAVELEPQSGAIVDSLGWAHYKLGQYSEARKNLEKAVELTPNSATIIDHLGDVYWRLGRYREAGFQWERALEFDPTDEERISINAKLKGGLSAGTSK